MRHAQADRADRRVGSGGRVHRSRSIREMARARRAARDLPAVESDLAQRGDRAGSDRLDRRPRARRHRQPVRARQRRRHVDRRSPRPTTRTSSPASRSASSPSRARRVTDTMIMAAAKELTLHVPTRTRSDRAAVAADRGARGRCRVDRARGRRARRSRDGVAPPSTTRTLERAIDAYVWTPRYQPYRRLAP